MVKFSDLMVGDRFRFAGGVSTFIKGPFGLAYLDGKPSTHCYPNEWDDVVPLNSW